MSLRVVVVVLVAVSTWIPSSLARAESRVATEAGAPGFGGGSAPLAGFRFPYRLVGCLGVELGVVAVCRAQSGRRAPRDYPGGGRMEKKRRSENPGRAS